MSERSACNHYDGRFDDLTRATSHGPLSGYLSQPTGENIYKSLSEMTGMADTNTTILATFTVLGLLFYFVLVAFTDLGMARIFAAVFIVGFVIPQILVRTVPTNTDS
jgi:hypothetical protein